MVDSDRKWGEEEAKRYEYSRHGLDGLRFLDLYISAFLTLARRYGPMLDVGTGAAAVPIEAVRDHGVEFVHGIDNSPAMIGMAEKAIAGAGLTDRISVKLADARSLPYGDSTFRRVTSVNVGCNLDPDTLSSHLREMARVVTSDGQILFAVPINLMEVFSDGNTARLRRKLITALTAIEKESTQAGAISQESIQRHIGNIDELHRGTFIERDGHLQLVTHGGYAKLPLTTTEDIKDGDPIWRKLPGLVVPNIYHPQEVYDDQICAAGLQVVDKIMGNFSTTAERRRSNAEALSNQPGQKLGAEYVGKGPFAVYILRK